MYLNSARIVIIVAMAMTSVCDGRAQIAVDQLQSLVETSAHRLNLAQEVAFAKWDNGTAGRRRAPRAARHSKCRD